MALAGSTIMDVVQDASERNLSNYNLLIKEKFVNNHTGINLVLCDKNLLDKYYYNLVDLMETRTLTEPEMERYRYRPDLFCYENYGSVELWAALLRFNNILTRAEFSKKKIKVFSMTFIDMLLSILSNEGDYIDSNNIYVSKK